MTDEQTNNQGLLANEPEIFDKVGRQRNNHRNENNITPDVHYNKNKLVPTKYH